MAEVLCWLGEGPPPSTGAPAATAGDGGLHELLVTVLGVVRAFSAALSEVKNARDKEAKAQARKVKWIYFLNVCVCVFLKCMILYLFFLNLNRVKKLLVRKVLTPLGNCRPLRYNCFIVFYLI